MHFVVLHFSVCLLRDVVEGRSCLEVSLGGIDGWEENEDKVEGAVKEC